MTPDSAAVAVPRPEDFGNPWMARLQEVGPPEAAPAWPPPPVWYLLAALVVLSIVAMAWIVRRRWQRGAYRREALDLLDGLEKRLEGEGSAPLAELPSLLKRVALRSFPRAEVAALSGEAFLAFLDEKLGTTEFRRGVGRAIPRLAYDPAGAELPPGEARALVRLGRRWIARHRASAGRGG